MRRRYHHEYDSFEFERRPYRPYDYYSYGTNFTQGILLVIAIALLALILMKWGVLYL